jgi:hypothetical protein
MLELFAFIQQKNLWTILWNQRYGLADPLLLACAAGAPAPCGAGFYLGVTVTRGCASIDGFNFFAPDKPDMLDGTAPQGFLALGQN